MADPKYAKLPGIVTDEPDVFETNDLPEDDQAQLDSAEGDSSVERIDIDTKKAFDKFNKSDINGAKIDFSDRLSRARRNGYEIAKTEYELAGEGHKPETPQEKFQRLQHEISELSEDMNKIKENLQTDPSTEKLTPVALTRQMESLQQQLGSLHMERQTPAGRGEPLSAPLKRLWSDLADGGKTQPSPGKAPADDAAATGVTYQLHYRPEQAKFTQSARAAALEQRLERLEAVLGAGGERLCALTADCQDRSLLGAVSQLTCRARLLEPAQLEQIEGRVHALGQKVSAVREQAAAAQPDAEADSRVAEMYEIMKTWDSFASTLPQISDRLQSLSALHQQALHFSETLTQLSGAQTQLTSSLGAHENMVKQIDKSLNDNLQVIKQNCDSLDERLKKLGK